MCILRAALKEEAESECLRQNVLNRWAIQNPKKTFFYHLKTVCVCVCVCVCVRACVRERVSECVCVCV